MRFKDFTFWVYDLWQTIVKVDRNFVWEKYFENKINEYFRALNLISEREYYNTITKIIKQITTITVDTEDKNYLINTNTKSDKNQIIALKMRVSYAIVLFRHYLMNL